MIYLQAGLCLIFFTHIVPRPNAKPVYVNDMQDECDTPGSQLAETIKYRGTTLQVSPSNPDVTIVHSSGLVSKRFCCERHESDDDNKDISLKEVAKWKNDPVRNKFHISHVVPENWNVTPETGPVKASTVMTPRDLITLLTIYFGEPSPFGGTRLPDNWANDNPEILEDFVDMESLSPALALLLGIEPARA